MHNSKHGVDLSVKAEPSLPPRGSEEFARDRMTWLAYLMLGYFAYLQAVLGPLMPSLRRELNFNYTVSGLHLSAFAFGMILVGVTAKPLTVLWGRGNVFWGGGLGMAAGAVMLTLSTHVAMTITSAVVMGYFGTLLMATVQSTLAAHHERELAVALTEANVTASACASLAPVCVGAWLQTETGWRGAVWIAVGAWVSLTVFFRHARLPAAQMPSNKAGERLPLPPPFWAYWVVVILGVAIEWCMIFWGASYLESEVGLSQAAAATTISAFLGSMVIGRLLGSRLTRVVRSDQLLVYAVVIAGAGFMLFWSVPPASLKIAGLITMGLGIANLFPLTLSVALKLVPRQVDAASARITLGAGLAILLAPLALGWIADRLGVRGAYGIVAVLLVVTAITIFVANRFTSNGKVEGPVKADA